MLCSLANVGEKDLAQVQSLEKKLGTTLLVYGCHEAKPAEPTSAQLEEIKKLEEKMGVVLVAVES